MGSGWLDLGHPHMTDGDFFRSHDMSQEQAAGMSDAQLHPPVTAASGNGGMAMPSWAKKAGIGLIAGAAVGMLLLQVPAYSKMMSKQKSWQAAAIGAAVAVPLVATYA